MRTLSLTIQDSLSGRTVHSVLKEELGLSESLIHRIKLREAGILLNGVRVYTTAIVKEGDTLTCEIGDDVPPAVTPIPLPLDIVYEDDDILILNKPAGIAVHPTQNPDEVSLENALAAYLKQGETAHPVSRLDRGTSGLMTIAKNAYMHEALRRLLHTPDFYREYRGIALGTPEPAVGKIDLPIGYAEGSRLKRAITPDGSPSLTEYEVLASGDQFSLLRLIPHTGRTHQLRVHLSAIGHPLAGDWLYGEEDHALIARPALHSAILHLKHPLTGQTLQFEAPLPDDMQSLLKRIEN